MNKPLILVDGSSYLYRAFHALPPLSTVAGQPTGAIYGVVHMLEKLLKAYHPEHIAIVLDTPGKTFRHDLALSYKANRRAMPLALQQQLEPLEGLIHALGLPLIKIAGFEADDIIATLATQAAQQQISVLISSGDKDFSQLVSPYINLVNTMTNTYLDSQGVIAKFGIKPEQMVDYLALIGDSIDNIPGVANIGPKTAAKWLNHYGNLINLIEQAAEIQGKAGQSLRASLEQLQRSRQLICLKQDIPLTLHLTDLQRRPKDHAALIQWVKKLEFKKWLRALQATEAATTTPMDYTRENYQIILTEASFEQWLTQLEQAAIIAIDTETTGLDYLSAQLVGLSFASQAGQAAYLPLAHDYPNAPQQLSREQVLERLKPLLEDLSKKKIGHNLKYDSHIFANYGIYLKGLAFDTLLEAYLLDSASNHYDLDTQALKHLNHHTIRFTDIAGKGNKQLQFNQIPLEQAGYYAAEDADISLQLHQILWPQLEKKNGLADVLRTIEMPLIDVLVRMERRGVLIDTALLVQHSQALANRLKQLEEQAYQLAGQVFNLGSPKQLQAVLYTSHNLPILAKTPTGQASTSEYVLQTLALDFPLPRIILEHRSLSKLKSTYTDRLPQQVHPKTGRIHTAYHQAAVATGRLSSSDPNLQNIPIRTEEGRKIRQAFIAPPGYKILAADYSQIELRIMAHFSQDSGLLNAFKQGLDIHKATAAEVLGIELTKITPEQRRRAKAINFGLLYGMSAFGLAKQLRITREAAQAYINRYFAHYPGVKRYIESIQQTAHQNTIVKTLSGRCLHLPEINARNKARQRTSERLAVNAPLQGSAADIIKLAMINIDKALQTTQLDAHMILQVHDELVFEVAESALLPTKALVTECMTNTIELSIPLSVDIGIGNNWDEAH